MQDLVAVGLIVEEISNVYVKCVKVTAAQNICQGHRVKVSAESVHREEALSTVQGLVVVGLIVEEISNIDVNKMCQSHWSTKYRPRSPDSGTCKVHTQRRSTMQGLVVVGLIVKEISNIDVKRVSHSSVIYRSRSPRQKNLPSQYIEEKHYARFGGCRPYS